MSKSSREGLFGITLTELVIILFFIMLLLAILNIEEVNEELEETQKLIPESSEDIIPKSVIVDVLFPDGEITSDLVPVKDIEDKIRELQKAQDDFKKMTEESSGGDGDCKEGGNWINSKCADYCWAVDAEENKRPYDVLLDIGMCESSIVVRRSQWLKYSESDFLEVPGAYEAAEKNVMSRDNLYSYLDDIKKPGYEKNPKQCFHVVRLVELEQIYADPWTKNMLEVQERVSTELYTLGKPGYSKVREQFSDDICIVANNEGPPIAITKNQKDFSEINSFQEPVSSNQRQEVSDNTLSIVNADLDIESFQTEATKECNKSSRFRNKAITLEFVIEIDTSGKPISVELTPNNPSLNNTSSKLNRLAIRALKKSSYTPQMIEGVAINSFHNERLKFPDNFCSF